ncbi:MAG: hypothetical protein ACR2JE_12175 [Acidobacteriaceae bacterium]
MLGTLHSAKKFKRTTKAAPLLLCLLSIAGVASAQAAPRNQPATRKKLEILRPQPLVREADLNSGANLTLEVNVGDVRILPAEKGGRLRLVLTVKHFDDVERAPSWIREFSVSGTQGKIVLNMPKHGDHGGDVTLFVPPATNLKTELDVGDLRVEGIAGDKDLKVGIGDLDVGGVDAKSYHSIHASVGIGDLTDHVFDLSPSGFLGKSASKQTGEGPYRLRLHVTIGDIVVKPEMEQQTMLYGSRGQ